MSSFLGERSVTDQEAHMWMFQLLHLFSSLATPSASLEIDRLTFQTEPRGHRHASPCNHHSHCPRPPTAGLKIQNGQPSTPLPRSTGWKRCARTFLAPSRHSPLNPSANHTANFAADHAVSRSDKPKMDSNKTDTRFAFRKNGEIKY